MSDRSAFDKLAIENHWPIHNDRERALADLIWNAAVKECERLCMEQSKNSQIAGNYGDERGAYECAIAIRAIVQ